MSSPGLARQNFKPSGRTKSMNPVAMAALGVEKSLVLSTWQSPYRPSYGWPVPHATPSLPVPLRTWLKIALMFETRPPLTATAGRQRGAKSTEA